MTQAQDNLLIIGARSLIGRRIAEALATGDHGDGQQGHADCANRNSAGLNWPTTHVFFSSRQATAGPQTVVLDTADPEAFQPGTDFTCVIMCAPIWLVTEKLLTRLYALGLTRLIVFSSTSRLTKGASAEPEERDVVARLEAGEATTIDFCTAHQIAWTILRPTLIYDEGHDQNVSQIAAVIRRLGFFPVCGPASGLRQPVHARDLAAAALLALLSKVSQNKTYNLSGAEAMTYREMVRRIFLALGRPPAIIGLPIWMWQFIFALLNLVRAKAALKRNISMFFRMNKDLWFDHSQAIEDFGYAPRPFKPKFTPL